MPIVDMTDPYQWETTVEANLFSVLNRMERAGTSEARMDEYFDKRVSELEIERKAIRKASGLDLPWWVYLWRFITNGVRRFQLFLFPSEQHKSGPVEYINPVGDIPILGQLFGVGMEVGKSLRPGENIIIRNQYGSIPILSDVFKIGGSIVSHWRIIAIGGVVLIGLFAGGKVVGIIKAVT
jgi:hypothetical protein